MKRKAVISLSSALLMIGCATNHRALLQKIEPGMSKSEVIESVGGPNRIVRRNGIETWVYYFDPTRRIDDQQHALQITFKSALATTVGPRQLSAVSASQQDEINQRANENADRLHSLKTQARMALQRRLKNQSTIQDKSLSDELKILTESKVEEDSLRSVSDLTEL